jgi:hypothetical protein
MCLSVGLDVLTWVRRFNMDSDSMCLRVGLAVGLTWNQIACVSGLG